jgi:hypothetical protein
MKIGQLKTLIAAYLHKEASSFVKGTGADQVDLLLVALNNARKSAEREHDFAACLKGGYYTVGATGANWTSGITWWDAGTQKVRKVKNWYLRGSDGIAGGEYGNDTILRATDKDTKVKAQASLDYSSPRSIERYPGTVATGYDDPLLGQTYVILNGQKVSLHPVPTSNQILTVDACFWWPSWTASTDDDWFTENGEEYLMLQGIVEANKLIEKFVGNVEGNLPPPTKDVERALAQLIATDEDSTDASQFLEPL